MPVFLHALMLKNYRGIGDEFQKLSQFKDFNFFIGANNSGKSTILEFIKRYLITENNKRPIPAGLELHNGARSGQPEAAVGIPRDVFVEAISRSPVDQHNETISQISSLLSEDGIVWITLPFRGDIAKYLKKITSVETREFGIHDQAIQTLWNALTSQGRGGIDQHWIPETLSKLLAAQSFSFPRVRLIPAIRQIGPKSQEFSDFSGQGLIDRLAEIQSPDHDKRSERNLFDSINRFLQHVTTRENARIEVPHNRQHILVHMDNKVLPLSSLGMGIHEVIMIAAFCTLSQEEIVCIEEPEIHLHPLLQRKLVSYLRDNTTNQYFIATHSASFVDTPSAAIFHVRNDGSQTRIQESVLKSERFSICLDLGIRASDILQSNAVVWVEGPSDRIYLEHWISALAPELIESTHYSIMFYGGRLLSHLSATDKDVTEFISLRSLNRHLAIIMDCDKTKAEDAINETKIRLFNELNIKPGLAWITKGREIENYVPHDRLQAAVASVHSTNYDGPASGGQFDHALYFKKKESTKSSDRIVTDVDKVKVAKAVRKNPADLDVLDLRDRVGELVAMIRGANGLDAP